MWSTYRLYQVVLNVKSKIFKINIDTVCQVRQLKYHISKISECYKKIKIIIDSIINILYNDTRKENERGVNYCNLL